jgi:hypothetical protein
MMQSTTMACDTMCPIRETGREIGSYKIKCRKQRLVGPLNGKFWRMAILALTSLTPNIEIRSA